MKNGKNVGVFIGSDSKVIGIISKGPPNTTANVYLLDNITDKEKKDIDNKIEIILSDNDEFVKKNIFFTDINTYLQHTITKENLEQKIGTNKFEVRQKIPESRLTGKKRPRDFFSIEREVDAINSSIDNINNKIDNIIESVASFDDKISSFGHDVNNYIEDLNKHIPAFNKKYKNFTIWRSKQKSKIRNSNNTQEISNSEKLKTNDKDESNKLKSESNGWTILCGSHFSGNTDNNSLNIDKGEAILE